MLAFNHFEALTASACYDSLGGDSLKSFSVQTVFFVSRPDCYFLTKQSTQIKQNSILLIIYKIWLPFQKVVFASLLCRIILHLRRIKFQKSIDINFADLMGQDSLIAVCIPSQSEF